jgi:hypothetical protein
MTSKRKRRLPVICIDENLGPAVAAAFRPEFRVVEIAKTSRFKGREEREYLAELYRENAVFVTSDGDFVNDAVERDLRHAGIVYVPSKMTHDEKVYFAEVVGGFIRGGSVSSPHVFRGCVLYPGYDGLRAIRSKIDNMEFSWDLLSQMLNSR